MGRTAFRRGATSRALALLALPVFAVSAPAQSPRPDNLGIDHFGLDDGLPGMYIPDLAVTGDGMLWLSASGLLVSFDGLEFQEHDLAAFPSPERTLRGVGPGRSDTLWVIVGQRLFSLAGGRVRQRAEFETLARGAWQSEDGTIRAWDNLGMMRLGESGFVRELRLAPNLSPGVPAPGARAGAPAGLWLHHPEPGALRRVSARSVLDPLPFPAAWPVPDPGNRILLTRPGAGRSRVVTRLDGTPVTTIPAGAGDWPLLLDRRGLLWTQRPGRVMAIDAAGEIFATLPLAPGARVTAVAEDSEGNVWLGTLTDGLYRIRPRAVTVLGAAAGLTDGQVLRVSGGDRGSVLVLENSGRAIRVGTEGVDTIFEPTAEAGQAHAALADRRGTVWVSVLERAPARLRGRTADGTVLEFPVPSSPRLLEDPVEDGLLWALSEDVLEIRPYVAGGPSLVRHSLGRGWGSRDMLVDPEGVVWVTGRAGLARIADGSVERFRVDEGFPLAGGRALHRSADGAIWIGLYREGLVRFRDGEFRAIRAADGLWDDGVSAILEDGAGNLWMSGNRGVHRVALQELNAFLDGNISRVRGHGYGQDAGFQNAETSGWHGYRSPDGRLWFPTFSGVAVIDPAEVMAREQVPPGIRIDGVNAGGSVLPPDSVITLKRGQRRIDIAYGATLLSGHGGVRYEVILEGVDSDWVHAGRQRQVSYGNVPPGRHVFRARAISGAGVTSLREATSLLIVPPYFYETASFRLLMVLLAGTALWSVYHLRVRQLRARAVTLRRLVDERTQELTRSQAQTEAALATVEAQARELRSLDEAKSRFFANVSHELRTPLTLVQGPLQDVLDGRLGPTPDAVKEQVTTVLASGRRLGELVEQLLDVARLESGELRLHLRKQDLRPLFARLARSFEALARHRGIAFEATLPPGAIQATADADQIEKVYGNLLANAFKFTAAGGRVQFIVETLADRQPPGLIVTVEDDGPGIPVAEQERIFERFHQVDDSSKRTHGGAGLGLALVKEVTELHGGSVEVWSRPGSGSRFTVRIPLESQTGRGAIPQSAAPPASTATHSDIESADLEARVPPSRAPAAAPSTATNAPAAASSETGDDERPTVLVVEDHDELRAYLRRHLEDRYRVIEAPDGGTGLDIARRTVPDMILCDIMMPEMDGEELCRAIRTDPDLAYLPVIMLTARASRQSRLSALEGGADDYLVKPFDPEELRLRVGNALASRRRFAERLRAEGKAMPFVALELPDTGPERDFATRLDAVLRERMGDEDFDVDQMASALAMSRATLYRHVDEALGMSPMEVLWTFRLKQAEHWLRQTDGTVSEIAYASGFKTVPHFTRRFKERFGTTPAAYRRRPHRTGS